MFDAANKATVEAPSLSFASATVLIDRPSIKRAPAEGRDW
jgi:hypothetical protein